MTDKFVVSTNEIGAIIVIDVETDKVYFYDTISDFFGLIRLLNEQQATIRKLQDLCGESDSENAKLRRENEQLRFLIDINSVSERTKLERQVDEQQATINNQEQKIKILQQEINDTQAILEMLTEKLKGWNDE